MTKRKFLYFLTDGTKSYFVNGGLVQKQATPVPLDVSPSGWQSQSLKYTRNLTYHGLVPSYTVPLKFVKTAAQILRHLVYTQGVETECFLVILKLNAATGKHESYFKGEIDFSKYTDTKDFFEVSITETGFYKNLKAYESTPFEFAMNSPECVDVELSGLALQKTSTFAVVDGSFFLDSHTIGCTFVTDEGTSFDILTANSIYGVTNFDFTINNDRWILSNIGTETISFNVTGQIEFEINGFAKPLRMFFINSALQEFVFVPSATYQPGRYSIPINVAATLAAGQKLFIVCEMQGNVFPQNNVTYLQTNIRFSYFTKFKTTTAKAINPFNVAEFLLKKIAGDRYTLQSDYLKNCGIYLTCGDALRGFENAKMQTTFKEFFDSFYRNLAIGLSQNGDTITIEPLQNFYNSGLQVYSFGNVSDVKIEFDIERVGTTLKIGYPSQEYDNLNGRDEFNNSHTYKLPYTRIPKEIELTANYRADAYGVEFTRINLAGKLTTDNKADKDVFMLDVLVTGANTAVLNRPNYSVITGTISPTSLFNTRLTPKNLLKVHGNYLRSIFYKQDGQRLSFQATEKNSQLSVTLNGVTTTENADVPVNTLGQAYFVPFKVRFKTVVPQNLLELMRTPYGLFSFVYGGVTYSGFMLEASQQPSGNEPQEITLLLSANNNLNQLVHG